MDTSNCKAIHDKITQEKSFKNQVINTCFNLATREKLFEEEDYKERKEFHNN